MILTETIVQYSIFLETWEILSIFTLEDSGKLNSDLRTGLQEIQGNFGNESLGTVSGDTKVFSPETSIKYFCESGTLVHGEEFSFDD